MQLGQLDAQLHAQRGVQVGQGLIEQEQLGPAHDGPPDRHPLALAARELLGIALQQGHQLQHLRCLLHPLRNFSFGVTCHAQTKRHVLLNRHVRVQRIALKHHGRAALSRAQIVDPHAVNEQVARADGLQTSDHAQRGRFAAARGANEDDELAVPDVQTHITDDLGLAVALGDVLENNRGHRLNP